MECAHFSGVGKELKSVICYKYIMDKDNGLMYSCCFHSRRTADCIFHERSILSPKRLHRPALGADDRMVHVAVGDEPLLGVLMSVLLLLLVGVLLGIGLMWFWLRHSMSEPVGPFARTESDNSPEAMYEQGMAYRRGQDLELDFQAARRLLRRAAEMNYAPAQYEYGMMLDRGLGGERDQVKSLRWIELAARGGSLEARLQMGQRYNSGDGVEKDLVRAEMYLRGAAEAGLAEAQTVLGCLYRDSEPPLANPVLAAEWLNKAVAQRYPAAFFPLSDLYERGLGVPRDLKKSDELLLQAAEFGEPLAQLKIARYYLTGAYGHIFPHDYRAALDWFKRAASHGVAEGEYEVGVRYERNEGVDAPDMTLALASYLKAAEMGFAPAQYRLGQVYLYGQGVNQNLREASRWFAAAAAQGHSAAAKHAQRLRVHVTEEPGLVRVAPMNQSSDDATDWKG